MPINLITKTKAYLNYGQFYSIKYLLICYKLKLNKGIAKLAKLNAECSNLKAYLNNQELNQIKPLINMALSIKNNKYINDIIAKKQPSQKHSIGSCKKAKIKENQNYSKLKQLPLGKKIKPGLSRNFLKRYSMYSF